MRIASWWCDMTQCMLRKIVSMLSWTSGGLCCCSSTVWWHETKRNRIYILLRELFNSLRQNSYFYSYEREYAGCILFPGHLVLCQSWQTLDYSFSNVYGIENTSFRALTVPVIRSMCVPMTTFILLCDRRIQYMSSSNKQVRGRNFGQGVYLGLQMLWICFISNTSSDFHLLSTFSVATFNVRPPFAFSGLRCGCGLNWWFIQQWKYFYVFCFVWSCSTWFTILAHYTLGSYM